MHAGRDECYVAGGMRGYARFNFEAFDAVAAHCRNVKKWRTHNPADHDRETWPEIETWPGFATGDVEQCPAFDLAEAMRWDLVKAAQSEHLVLLPGWEKSTGARHERYVAEVTGSTIWLAKPYGPKTDTTWFLETDTLQIRVTAETVKQPDVGWGDNGPSIGVDSHPVYGRWGKVEGDDLERIEVAAAGGPFELAGGPSALNIDGHAFATLDSGQRQQFESGMVRDTADGKPRYDLIPIMPLRRLAELYTRGAVKYGDCNWQKANSAEELQRFKSSAFRHFIQWLDGDTNEDHAIGTVWNIFAVLWLEAKLNEVAA